jgi:plastocyanin
VTIEIQTAQFFPREVHSMPGRPVRWVNRLSRSAQNERTVTSGTGPDDPDAGALFDELVVGFAEGEEDDFVFRFDEPGEYPYFSRLPSGEEFTGTVTVP